MKTAADMLRNSPVVKAIIERHNFTPVAFVKDVPAAQYPEAIRHLLGPRCQKRWNAKKDHIAQTYTFSFEDKEDAFTFRLCI